VIWLARTSSGKSTIAEGPSIRALFLAGFKTGGSVLDAMKSDPFMADPEGWILAFSCARYSWVLRQTLAGTGASVFAAGHSGAGAWCRRGAEERLPS